MGGDRPSTMGETDRVLFQYRLAFNLVLARVHITSLFETKGDYFNAFLNFRLNLWIKFLSLGHIFIHNNKLGLTVGPAIAGPASLRESQNSG